MKSWVNLADSLGRFNLEGPGGHFEASIEEGSCRIATLTSGIEGGEAALLLLKTEFGADWETRVQAESGVANARFWDVEAVAEFEALTAEANIINVVTMLFRRYAGAAFSIGRGELTAHFWYTSFDIAVHSEADEGQDMCFLKTYVMVSRRWRLPRPLTQGSE